MAATTGRADERRTIIASWLAAAPSLDHRIAPNADGGSIEKRGVVVLPDHVLGQKCPEGVNALNAASNRPTSACDIAHAVSRAA